MWFAVADCIYINAVGSGQCIGDYIRLSFKITNIRCEFSNTSELIGLARCQGIGLLVKTRHYGLLICEDGEGSTFHHVAEVADRTEDS